jgi:hypothetical protein
MSWNIALIIMIGIVLLIGVVSILVNVYLLLGFFFPILNLETERKIRKVLWGKSSPIFINPHSYIRERNARLMMRVGWVTFLSAIALCLIILLIVNLA